MAEVSNTGSESQNRPGGAAPVKDPVNAPAQVQSPEGQEPNAQGQVSGVQGGEAPAVPQGGQEQNAQGQQDPNKGTVPYDRFKTVNDENKQLKSQVQEKDITLAQANDAIKFRDDFVQWANKDPEGYDLVAKRIAQQNNVGATTNAVGSQDPNAQGQAIDDDPIVQKSNELEQKINQINERQNASDKIQIKGIFDNGLKTALETPNQIPPHRHKDLANFVMGRIREENAKNWPVRIGEFVKEYDNLFTEDRNYFSNVQNNAPLTPAQTQVAQGNLQQIAPGQNQNVPGQANAGTNIPPVSGNEGSVVPVTVDTDEGYVPGTGFDGFRKMAKQQPI
ncbi:MAG: hypothetical protein ACUZ8I_10380 [Candidatus Scalindua sp.]